MTKQLTAYECKVHYDDDQSAIITVYLNDDEVDIEKCVRRAAVEKANHVGERNWEGSRASERPNPTWAEIVDEKSVEVSES